MSQMNAEIKAKWIAALLSGAYQQGTRWLGTATPVLIEEASGSCDDVYSQPDKPEQFCCLGVLTDIYLKEHDRKWEKPLGLRPEDNVWFGLGHEQSITPAVVTEWAGLPDQNPEVPNPCGSRVLADSNVTTSLAALNDNGYTFEEIAKIIEENL